jgi:site-specific recombinase XerD
MGLEHSLRFPSQAHRTLGLEHNPKSINGRTSTLHGLVEYYLLSCKVEQKSPQTLLVYSQRLNDLLRFTDLNSYNSADSITPYVVRLFLSWLQDRGLCANTIRAYYRALHSFFAWLIREDMMSEHPMTSIKPPKVPKKLVQSLTLEHIKAVLSIQTSRHFVDIRNCAMFLMFIDTGLRLREMSGIQLSHVDIDKGTILVMGKGAKERRVRMGKRTHKALLHYWLLRRESSIPFLWLTEEKQAMQRNGVQMAIRRMLRRAGCEGVKIGPHTLRHTAAMNYLRNGGDLATLQVMLGHADITTTKCYLSSLAAEDMMKVHEKASPVDNLKL